MKTFKGTVFQYKICYSKIIWKTLNSKVLRDFNTKFVIAKYFQYFLLYARCEISIQNLL